jgi:methyl-accepting chemotaxis protein
MKKMSVIHRLYLGFGLLCVIIAGWGLFNGNMMTSISEGTSEVKERIFPFQRSVQAVEASTASNGMAVISLARVRDGNELEVRSGTLTDKMAGLDRQVESLVAEADNILLLTGFEKPARQYRQARIFISRTC